MKVVVTRHPNLVQLLLELGLIEDCTPVFVHANADSIRGMDVIGVLPNHLAAIANSITEIPLALDPEDRGKELSIERLRELAGHPVTYKVVIVKDHYGPIGHFAVRFHLNGMGGEFVDAVFDNDGRGKFGTRHEAGAVAANVLMANPAIGEAQVVCVVGDSMHPVKNYLVSKGASSTSVVPSEPRFITADVMEIVDAVEKANLARRRSR